MGTSGSGTQSQIEPLQLDHRHPLRGEDMWGTRIVLRGVFAAAAVVGAQLLTSGAPVLAQPVVRIGDEQVIDVKVGTRVYSTWARARIIQTNLDNALISAVRRGLNPIPVTVVNVNGHPHVQVAGYTVAVAGEDTAQAAGKGEQELAQQWANSISQAISNKDVIKNIPINCFRLRSDLSPLPKLTCISPQPTDRACECTLRARKTPHMRQGM